jgi:hypothetical protein
MAHAVFAGLGLLGSAIVVIAYFANHRGLMATTGWPYSAANLAGATLILISLYDEWNLPSVVVEAFWAAISLYGLWRAFAARSRA